MLTLDFQNTTGEPFRVLCLGAHCDDIEIGCGGTLMHLLESWPAVEVAWVVFTSDAERAKEASASAHQWLKGAAAEEVIVRESRHSFLPYEGAKLKEFFETLKEGLPPDLIFTHYRHDLHQDHRVVNELTWNTFRNHTILEYEIPKYDGDISQPNVFVPLEERICLRKTEAILRGFPSQAGKSWFTKDLFLSVMRIRGMECSAPERHAEAFHCRKLVLSARLGSRTARC